MENSAINKVTKIVVDIFFYIGIVYVISVPFLRKILQMHYNYGSFHLKFMTATLFISGISAVYILYNLKCMFKTLTGGNPFVRENIKCFTRMAVASAIIALIYIAKAFVLFSPATVTVICVFAITALFCLTLRDIFKQAIAYKEENDWTV